MKVGRQRIFVPNLRVNVTKYFLHARFTFYPTITQPTRKCVIFNEYTHIHTQARISVSCLIQFLAMCFVFRRNLLDRFLKRWEFLPSINQITQKLWNIWKLLVGKLVENAIKCFREKNNKKKKLLYYISELMEDNKRFLVFVSCEVNGRRRGEQSSRVACHSKWGFDSQEPRMCFPLSMVLRKDCCFGVSLKHISCTIEACECVGCSPRKWKFRGIEILKKDKRGKTITISLEF